MLLHDTFQFLHWHDKFSGSWVNPLNCIFSHVPKFISPQVEFAEFNRLSRVGFERVDSIMAKVTLGDKLCRDFKLLLSCAAAFGCHSNLEWLVQGSRSDLMYLFIITSCALSILLELLCSRTICTGSVICSKWSLDRRENQILKNPYSLWNILKYVYDFYIHIFYECWIVSVESCWIARLGWLCSLWIRLRWHEMLRIRPFIKNALFILLEYKLNVQSNK